MGTDNVRLTFAVWGDLPHLPFRVLTFMALCSLDKPQDGKPARVYYGGREHLSAAVRLDPLPPEPDDLHSAEAIAADKERRATFQTLKRALAELKRAGAIDESKSRRGTYRSTAEYVLSFDRVQGVAERTPMRSPADAGRGTEDVPLQGVAERTRRGTENVPVGVRQAYPLLQALQLTSSDPLQDSVPEVPHQRAKPAGRDDEYEAAHKTLMAHGPRAHDLVAQILATYPDTSTRDAAVQAARTLKEPA